MLITSNYALYVNFSKIESLLNQPINVVEHLATTAKNPFVRTISLKANFQYRTRNSLISFTNAYNLSCTIPGDVPL